MKGYRTVKFLMTVLCSAASGVVEDAFLMQNMLKDGASLIDG